jgi:hypothetical protein
MTTPPASFPFRRRGYLHFDEPISKPAAVAIATAPETVASWSFLPFLRHDITLLRVEKDSAGQLQQREPKDRPICYASHKDAAIYAWYGAMLTARYEERLNQLGLCEHVTAFRPAAGRCNLDYAGEVFDWIRQTGTGKAYAFDIRKFFDRLSHARLKSAWAELLGQPRLPDDHFAVFKSLTRFSYVRRDAAYRALGVSKHKPKANGRTRLCTPLEFRQLIRDGGLIESNEEVFGIPQGSPMSAVLSNLYMLQFDRELSGWVRERGGFYRRYCDDILIAMPESAITEDVTGFVTQRIAEQELEIQPDKTTQHCFSLSGTGVALDKPLSYLGLVFDGARVLLRPVGIARYYTKMHRGVSLAGQTMRKWSKGEPIKRRKLFVLYSYVGRHNYPAYAFRAARKLNSPAIKRQLKGHWRKLLKMIEKAQQKYGQE